MRNPRCLYDWLGRMTGKGCPCRVMLSVATRWPVRISMAVIPHFFKFISMPAHSKYPATFETRIAIAGMASGPSVCSGVSSARPLEPVGAMFPCSVQPRLESRTTACTGSNVVLKIRGLGWAPCATPRLSTHAALRPNLLAMTRKEPVYIRRNNAISAGGKPLASRI